MKCPHCQASLRYRERSNRTCPKCMQRFALEPRSNPLRISDLKLRSLAERLSQHGAYRYTSAHLCQAAILQSVKPTYQERFSWPYRASVIEALRRLLGQVGVGIIFVLLIPLCGWLNLISSPSDLNPLTVVSMLAVSVFFVIGPVYGVITAIRQSRRLPDIDHIRFERECLAPWEAMYGRLPGRLDREEVIRLRVSCVNPPEQRIRAIVASPNEDVLDCLRANELPQHLGVALINPDSQPAAEAERLIEFARQHPALPILLVHDASVAGCMLPYLLPARWGLSPGHRIIDLGLRPRHVRQLRLPWRYERVPRGAIDFLKRAAEMSVHHSLDRDEIAWLSEGSTASVLCIPPSRLISIVTQAVKRTAPPLPDPETEAQAQARAIGFMTWPQRAA